MMTEPRFSSLIGFALPWSASTKGPVSAPAVLAFISNPQDFERYKGKLRGKIVLIAKPHASQMITSPLARRLTDADLDALETAPAPTSGNPPELPVGFFQPPAAPEFESSGPKSDGPRTGARQFRSQFNKFLKDEGALVVLTPGTGTDGGDVTGGAAGSQDPKIEPAPPSVVLTNEHYNRIVRLVEKNIPVTLEFDIQTKFVDAPQSFNVTAEIPGSDSSAGLVMLGAPVDSWAGGTGATDNAAGSAVVMEAARILKSLKLSMPRTVRLALWTGEEEGLLGSRAYVKEHFADPVDMKLKPEHAKFSAYFNLDNGSGKIRGMYLQDNTMLRPIFESWFEPLKDLGVRVLTIRNAGSTDHEPFNSVGLPGFQFVQDPLEYSTRTHHTNMDLYDHLQADDLEQASAVMAWVVYNAATRPEMLPRTPLPQPKH
jgi:Zn-dependent M28 family amino/carboxypeptidase